MEAVKHEYMDVQELTAPCKRVVMIAEELLADLERNRLIRFLESLSRMARAIHKQRSSLKHERQRRKALREGKPLCYNGKEDLLRFAIVTLIPHDTLLAFADEIDAFLKQKRYALEEGGKKNA